MSDIPALIRAALATNRILTVTLQARINPVLDRLTQEQDLLDGYSSTASGADNGPPGHSTTSSTEAAVTARLAAGRLCPTCDAEGTTPDGKQCKRCKGTGYLPASRATIEPTTVLDEGLDLARAATQIMRLLHAWCDNHGEQLTAADLNRLRCINWRADDGHSCGNFATPRRHNNTTIEDGRCLPCGQAVDELDDKRRKEREADTSARRLRRYTA